MKFKKFSLALLFFVVNVSLLFTFMHQNEYTLKVGQIAKEEITAPKDAENKVETEKLTKRAVEEVQPIYTINPTVQLEIKSDIEEFFTCVASEKSKDIDENQKIEDIRSKNVQISKSSIQFALDSDYEHIDVYERYIFEIINQIMAGGIQKEDIISQKEIIEDYLNKSNRFNKEERIFITDVINTYIRPNKFLDIEKTQEKIDSAKESVQKVMIYKGDTIISKGELVTQEKIDLLKSIGALNKNSREDILILLASAIIVCILEFLCIMHFRLFDEELMLKEKNIFLVILVVEITFIVGIFLKVLTPYIIPIAMCSMLISILLKPQIAMLANLILSIFIYLVVSNEDLFIVSLISGTYASYASFSLNQRSNILLYGLKVGIINFFALMALAFMHPTTWNEELINGVLIFLSAIVSSIFVVGTLPLWEYYFDILTPLKLLEYSSPNNDILKRMVIETPGTYHHSIIVGNLAERACDSIRANSLLARVASYYHDVGKLSRPFYFKENQLSSMNPHDRLKPQTSARIIKRHVEDGVNIAKKHKIPTQIVNIIREHHGQTLIAYFYYKAKESGVDVVESDFRYDGPKPQTKEAAVVMMADSVEASIRSIKDPTKEKIEDMISKVVNGKLNDGQLDKCNLNFKDIDSIKEAFEEVILGMFHERIEYPEDGGIENEHIDRQ